MSFLLNYFIKNLNNLKIVVYRSVNKKKKNFVKTIYKSLLQF